MAIIYRHIQGGADQRIGRIETGTGYVFHETHDPNQYSGWVDYDDGQVFDRQLGPSQIFGWLNARGEIFTTKQGAGQPVGRIENNGKLFKYDQQGQDLYLGRLSKMAHPVEGAGALLLIFN